MHLLDRLRLFLLGFVAVSVSLPMAWVSLGKLVLFVTCLTYLVGQLIQKKGDTAPASLWSVRLIFFIVASFAFSLSWTEAPLTIAVLAFTKHSKLIEVVLLISLLRTPREALGVLGVYLAGQTFLLLSSWLMVVGWRVPWATSDLIPQYKNVVFSTYLDQTLMSCAAATMFWHLRSIWSQALWLKASLAALAIASVTNVLFFQEGKTGYVVALTVITLAFMWQMPRRWRVLALVVAPLCLGLLAWLGSAKIQERAAQVVNDGQNYTDHGNNLSSSGFRLHAWRRSLQAMAQQPLIGHGVGSWTQTVKRIEGPQAQLVFGQGMAGNPHQEYLLWGVELGIAGSLLLLGLIACLVRDALRFDQPVKRATLAITAVMAVASLFNCSLYDALIGDFFVVTLGLLLALGLRSKPIGQASMDSTFTRASA
ncbi:MAG: O-antigen ligase family protein [Rhodoferax sp.]|nr:O-antigen ligase family protein [Rhodoferax sp.]